MNLMDKLSCTGAVDLSSAERQLLLRLLQHAVDSNEYETEYARRMEQYCHFCGVLRSQGEEQPHEKDCLHLAAVKATEQGG